MRVAILGRTHWLLRTAELTAASGHKVALVATANAAPEYLADAGDFAALAKRHDAPFFNMPDVNGVEFVAALRAAKADIGISINWPTLIRQEACGSLAHGILNAHAGDLPRYRGNACPNWAIIKEESHIGLCVHAMDPNLLDAGPIFARTRLLLTDEVYITDVHAWMDKALPRLFLQAIDNVLLPGFRPEEQHAHGIRPLRTFPRRPEDGCIDWRMDSASIARLARASSRPFAGAFTQLEGKDRVTVWRAKVVHSDQDVLAVPGQIVGRGPSGGPMVACSEGVLEIEQGERESGEPLPIANRYRFSKSIAL